MAAMFIALLRTEPTDVEWSCFLCSSNKTGLIINHFHYSHDAFEIFRIIISSTHATQIFPI